eukprot:CAMPEP_0170473976 /NCGR_PEP_ID=MMETSP0123-20130129/15813_1 /TAXON_ID=182087 /ORGANISM="Favella ehrenbergii, Strain Fehren 1" /LENGTH=58 /DNA_ID=CAMNT_0010743397 /DNA_START=625 /DNA_END=801 /DNA_ORIENTATION=-
MKPSAMVPIRVGSMARALPEAASNSSEFNTVAGPRYNSDAAPDGDEKKRSTTSWLGST